MKELDVVRLIKEFEGMPINTEGTIVHKYSENDFEVEFFDNDGDTYKCFHCAQRCFGIGRGVLLNSISIKNIVSRRYCFR